MNRIRLLLVEDAPLDAELAIDALQQAGLDVDWHRVETEEELKAALDGERWDAVLADYTLPQLSAPAALRFVRARDLDVPVIVLSGTIGEEAAVSLMKAGAADCLSKDGLGRLAPALRRELDEARIRRERREAQAALRQAHEERAVLLEEAQRANRLKDEFLATMSHELRTPMNAILGWSEMLVKSDLDEAEERAAIQAIHRNARAQARIISDLLDMSRIITGKLALETQPVELALVVTAALEAVRLTAEGKGVTLVHDDGGARGLVLGDATRLQQVVWNLIANAIKFTPAGRQVAVTLREHGGRVELAVRDTGEGIEPAFLPHVFERFSQADGSITRRHGGLGLGLAIVKNLVELHAGTCAAYSAGRGQGSTFTITLPLASETARVTPSAAARKDAARLGGVDVLVVDDQEEALELVRCVLGRQGATVRQAGSADEALDMIHARAPDVLLSDLGMPEKSGLDLIQSLRRWERETGSSVRAAAFTAHARDEARRQAIEAGYEACLTKPVEPALLIATVSRLAGLSEAGFPPRI